MSTAGSDLTELNKHGEVLAVIDGLLVEAGQRLLRYFHKAEISVKGEAFDLVTNADYDSENFLKAEILAYFPNHTFFAEESFATTPDLLDDYCWMIDPLDGTVNFATGVPLFSISIALLYQGSPLLGWVYDPAHQEMFYARRGGGAFFNGQRLTAANLAPTSLPIGASSGLLNWSLGSKQSQLLQTLLEKHGKFRILGSQALHLAYVAAGRLQAALNWESKVWDDAAGALIVREAGGSYSDFWGRDIFPLTIDSPLLEGRSIHSLAAPPDIYSNILGLLVEANATDEVDRVKGV
ncbi:MAG: inositol monophosphatase family protein [Anaerolineae bacterium]|nr:inositol monophosphatase family protein [Anaerolineae bacterium]